MNTKNKIIAILMASIVAMAVGVPMAMGDQATTSANVGGADPTIDCTGCPSAVTLNQSGANVTVTITGTVGDANGWDNIDTVTSDACTMFGTHASDCLCTKTKVGATSGTFSCTFKLDSCTPSGDETVTVTVTDNESSPANCNCSVTVNGAIGLELDFIAIGYGSIEIGTEKPVLGDANTGTSGAPTVRNKGNDNMKIKINATKMTSGAAYILGDPSNVDMNQDAKVEGGTGVKKDLTADTEVSFDYQFVCNTPEPIDYFITAPDGTLGAYTGQVTITGVAA